MLPFLLIAVGVVAFAAGYLTRRWHRPTMAVALGSEATRIVVSGGTPYVSLSVASREPMDPALVTALVDRLRPPCA